jgi:hypothetical protein
VADASALTASALTASVNRLLAQVSHWQQPRWSSPSTHPPATRADVVHELVQRLADLAADAEGRARRPVPREHDLTLPDQLRVMAADLLAADPADDVLTQAVAAVSETRKALP